MPYFKSVLSELKTIEKNGDWDYIYNIVAYLFEAGEVKDQEDFVETIKIGLSVNEDKIMTLAERYRAKGEAEGIEKGIEKGREEIALKMLFEAVDIKQVSLFTDIPVEKLKALKKSKIS